jgi:predicted nucleic acid binding AN1-type Zn finger protein
MGDSMNVRALLREMTPQMGSATTSTTTPETISLEPAAAQAKPSNRCGACRKKLSLTDLACRCKARFCSAHRAPEEHACTHDFKADANAILKQQLERVVADKVDRF